MDIQRALRACIAMGFSIGLLAGCGGSGYGGGGGSNPPATLTISVDPSTITLGQSATITWNSNAPCTASGDWTGSKSRSGSEMVTPSATGSFTYTLVCRGDGYGSSERESTTLTVTPVAMAGLWIGGGCCVDSSNFAQSGLTNENGDYRFLLLGAHYIGKARAVPRAYATCDTCLAGPRLDDANAFKMFAITPGVSAIASVRAPPGATASAMLRISVPYDPASNRPLHIADLAGNYTTYLGTGYTLTITIDPAGRVSGTDTNGCSLQGGASAIAEAVNNFKLALKVSGCGTQSGRYDGNAALTFDSSGRPAGLFLSASNAKAAIGRRLSR